MTEMEILLHPSLRLCLYRNEKCNFHLKELQSYSFLCDVVISPTVQDFRPQSSGKRSSSNDPLRLASTWHGINEMAKPLSPVGGWGSTFGGIEVRYSYKNERLRFKMWIDCIYWKQKKDSLECFVHMNYDWVGSGERKLWSALFSSSKWYQVFCCYWVESFRNRKFT